MVGRVDCRGGKASNVAEPRGVVCCQVPSTAPQRVELIKTRHPHGRFSAGTVQLKAGWRDFCKTVLEADWSSAVNG
jgi:hypothetical protein